MTIISRRLPAPAGEVLMATALGRASTATKEGPGEYVDETVITNQGKSATFNDATRKSAGINVEAFKGTVPLSSLVNSRGDVNKAVAVARNVDGVKLVKNDCVSSGASRETQQRKANGDASLHPTATISFFGAHGMRGCVPFISASLLASPWGETPGP